MGTAGLVSAIISAITALGVWLSARESRKATTTNTTTSNRVEMEKEAYERARALDTDTIKRQHDELQELRKNQVDLNKDVKMVHGENEILHDENLQIREENYHLRAELAQLRRRFTLFQRGLPDDPAATIRERESDIHPMLPEARDGRE